jgi:hypothetical protein
MRLNFGFGYEKNGKLNCPNGAKLQMVDFMLECVLLSFKVCLGAVIITGIVILVAIPINYLTQTAKDRMEDWDFRREFDVWRLRNK